MANLIVIIGIVLRLLYIGSLPPTAGFVVLTYSKSRSLASLMEENRRRRQLVPPAFW